MRNVSDNIVEKKKHIFCSVTSFFFENRAVYEIILKNVIEQEMGFNIWIFSEILLVQSKFY